MQASNVTAALGLAVLLTGCGWTVTSETVAEPAGPVQVDEPHPPDAPPAVVVRHEGGSVELRPWTYCFGTTCADGMPPEPLPDVGTAEELTVAFPLDGWTFDATLRPVDDECGREFPTSLDAAGDGTHVLRPAGPAGDHAVTLFGQAPAGGDLLVSFRWTTTEDGALPSPGATLALLADHDGELDSYGVELFVRQLPTTPEDASATITVRDATGGTATVVPDREDLAGACRPPGAVAWRGPDAAGREAAAQLGDGPYTYEVELELDGHTYVGTATWPDDEDPDIAPAVPLTFDPPLPSLATDG